MAWTTGLDGFGKARLKKLQSLIQAVIPDLVLCFTADTTLSFLNTRYPGLITSANVIRGDYEAMWDIKVSGPFRIYVSAGGHREGVDQTQKDFYISGGSSPGGKQRFYSSTITCVFHPSAFTHLSPDLQTTIREDAYQTVMDWLDWDLFGKWANIKIPIASNCLDTQAGVDYLNDTKMVQAMKCFLFTGPGQTTTVTGIQAIVTGYC